ncbi:hypothetical protein N0V90_007652 [Kalmusia sp. IMI 367209]|nr:hypothetical protein N0V90_007652 [Kalmusia sp. IMI 367209]
MLQESVDEMKLPIRIAALANDSVGTLLSRAYTSLEHGSTLAGIIIGTGTNAAYIENLDNVKRLPKAKAKLQGASIVINTEWGCFDDELQVLPTTKFDRDLEASSMNPGNQQLEKRVSGMYLGELMRLVLLHCQSQGVFNMVLNDASPCNHPHGLDSSFLSLLATNGNVDTPEVVKAIERVLLAQNVTTTDARIIQKLADGIAKRSARLVGSALAAIIIQSGRLSHLQAEKQTVQVTSVQTQQHDSRSSKNRRRGCRLFARIADYIKKSSANSTQPTTTAESTLQGEVEEDIIDVGIDGSLIEHYPGFEAYMRSALDDVPEIGIEGEKRVKMGLAKDGSGVGAALMANAADSI